MTPIVVSVKENPALVDEAIRYISAKWAFPKSMAVYDDCIRHMMDADSDLPQWYLLCLDGHPIGCAGLIPNDFISRMDLAPWLCALYVEEAYRGHAFGSLLIERIKADAAAFGYDSLYLATDHIGYYEHYGFSHIGTGYHPWGESSRIYRATLEKEKKR